MKFNPFRFRYSRTVYGILCLLFGLVFVMVPFIPLGWVLLFAGTFLLAKKVPPFKRFLEWLKKKDKKGTFIKVEKKINHFFGDTDVQKQKRRSKSN